MEKQLIIFGSKSFFDFIRKRLKNDVILLRLLDFEEISFLPPHIQDNYRNIIYLVQNATYVHYLESKGINADRIIDYSLFKDATMYIPSAGFQKGYSGVMAGMSHAQTAFNNDLLKSLGLYKLASPSMDMFLHNKYIINLLKSNEGKKIERVVIELPYYIFNYDLSRFGGFVNTKLCYYEAIKDYHNYGKTQEQAEIIRQFHLYYSLIDCTTYKKDSEFVQLSIVKRFAKKMGVFTLLTIIRAIQVSIFNNDNVWNKVYNNTIEENIELWNELLTKVKRIRPNCKITVLIMPMNPIFRLFHHKSIKKQRDIFYNNIGNDVRIIDDFKYFYNPFLYSDHCHLNIKGSIRYGKHFKRLFEKNFENSNSKQQ